MSTYLEVARDSVLPKCFLFKFFRKTLILAFLAESEGAFRSWLPPKLMI